MQQGNDYNSGGPRRVHHVSAPDNAAQSAQGGGSPSAPVKNSVARAPVPKSSVAKTAASRPPIAKPAAEPLIAKAAAEELYAEENIEVNAPHGKTSKGKRKKSKASRILLFSILGLFVIAAAMLGKFLYDIARPAALFEAPTPAAALAPTPTPTPATTLAPNATPSPSPTPDPKAMLLSAADLEFMKNRVNILVLGLDESAERADWGAFRTDTMILVTIDFETNDVAMISIPRDSYVKIANDEGRPTGEFGKVNSAFSTGGGAKKKGFAYSMGTVSYILGGIPVQYYVGFNMNVVKEMVNAMGGLTYDVDTEVKMNGRELQPGVQHLDGQAVLDYCRQRKGSSDIERVERQQRMLKAIFHELKSTGQIIHIPEIYTAVQQNIDTNLSMKQISSLALLALNMDMDQLTSRTLDGKFLNMRSTSYWGLYTNRISTMIQEVFGISVHLDDEMNVTNVEAQIEANRQLIAAELSAAKAAIQTADQILSAYGAWLANESKQSLKSAKSQLEDAYDAEDKALLDAYTPPLQQLNAWIWSELQRSGAVAGGGDASGAGQGMGQDGTGQNGTGQNGPVYSTGE